MIHSENGVRTVFLYYPGKTWYNQDEENSERNQP